MTAPSDNVMRAFTGYRLRRATSAMLAPVGAALTPFGLRRTTFSALSIIVDRPGSTQARLADAMGMERPNIAQIVGELEAAGLVARARAQDDRRAYALRATETGRRIHARAWAAVAEVDRALVRGLSRDERSTLHRALALIERNAAEVSDGTWVSRA